MLFVRTEILPDNMGLGNGTAAEAENAKKIVIDDEVPKPQGKCQNHQYHTYIHVYVSYIFIYLFEYECYMSYICI